MPTPDDSAVSTQGTDHETTEQPPDDTPLSAGRDVLAKQATVEARERYFRQVDHRVESALQSARIGVIYNPFADAPGAIEASPATFWDYFVAEASKALPLSTYRKSADAQITGQADLSAFAYAADDGRVD